MNDCRFLTIAQSSASLAYHKPLTMHELKNCSGGGLLANAFGVSAAEFAPRKWPVRASRRVVTLLPETIAMDVAGLIFAVSRT